MPIFLHHRRLKNLLSGLLALVLFFSCQNKPVSLENKNRGKTLKPLVNKQENLKKGSESQEIPDAVESVPFINLGNDYTIITVLNTNLESEEESLEQIDEQIIVAIPNKDAQSPAEIMIVASKPKNRIVWRSLLNHRNLTGIILLSEDITHNGRQEILLIGFDTKGQHVTEIFSVPSNGEIDAYTPIFRLSVEGNIDIIAGKTSPHEGPENTRNTADTITVQKNDRNSINPLDLVEETWRWVENDFLYRQQDSQKIKAASILEERIAAVYSGNAQTYETYLKGPWYRETGANSPQDILYFNPEEREIIFYDGSIQEIYTWNRSHRTTTKRLYTRINNAIIPSMGSTISISAESWDYIELNHANQNWGGAYRRLGPALQKVLQAKASLSSVENVLPITGRWRSPNGTELFFDLPHIELKENEERQEGTASIFFLNEQIVLQIQLMQDTGIAEETKNFLIAYEEVKEDKRIVRSITLTPGILSVDGIRKKGDPWLRFGQIEILSTD